ncbi:MAG TPA: molybdenum cofactor biosynthesis protein B [Rhodothermales bacterium]|nr:molybdenum cofactor biosynthesis protein B [Rhodothermales bacterium]HRR08466.1 molybdenum cofactor biosynthesis protein B [Rhodothermales bacterium]
MSAPEHRRLAEQSPVYVGVLTISDTRTPETDQSGKWMKVALEAVGHVVTHYAIVLDEPDVIRQTVYTWSSEVQAIITSGGTGISHRDQTFEALSGLIQKNIPGFGEVFRMLSYHEVGAAAMLSRAVAGLIDHGTLLFCLPGSLNAVRLGMEKLILPEIAHMVWELKRT